MRLSVDADELFKGAPGLVEIQRELAREAAHSDIADARAVPIRNVEQNPIHPALQFGGNGCHWRRLSASRL